MDRTRCSEECKARSPLGSEGHQPGCPASNVSPLPFMPRGQSESEELVVRGPDGRPVFVPTEVIAEHERDYRAYTKWRAGHSWEDIARAEQYETPDAAYWSVKRYLQEGAAIMREMTRAEIVADHVSRLQWMRSRLEAGIDAGRPQAVMAGLAVEDRWVKAFGLDQEQEGDAGVPTVVVPTEDYLATLRAAAQDSDQVSAG